MTLPSDFQKQLLERTDAELYEMLAHRNDYLPEALDGVRKELSRRNLPSDRAGQLQAAAKAQKSEEDNRTETGLPWYGKVSVLDKMIGCICDGCHIIEIKSSVKGGHNCPQCGKRMQQKEVKEVNNRERKIFVFGQLGIALIFFIFGILIMLINESIGLGILILGGLFVAIPIIYFYIALFGSIIPFLGFGGWRWLTKKYELISPPSWYQTPSLRTALLNEIKITLKLTIAIILFGLFVKFITELLK